MVFEPRSNRSAVYGVGVALLLLVMQVALMTWIGNRAVDWLTFLGSLLAVANGVLLLTIALRVWTATHMEYWLDRNAVVIRTPLVQYTVPIAAVERLVSGSLARGDSRRNLEWPAPYIWSDRASDAVPFHMLATQPLSRCVILDTGETGAFALSPADEEEFIHQLQLRRQLGVSQALAVREDRLILCSVGMSGDGFGRFLLMAGGVGVLFLFGMLTVQYPSLPDMLAFHYNRQGNPDLIQHKAYLFLIPMIGFVSWMMNGLWGLWLACRRQIQQRAGSYLLWGGAVTVQIFCLLALSSLLR